MKRILYAVSAFITLLVTSCSKVDMTGSVNPVGNPITKPITGPVTNSSIGIGSGSTYFDLSDTRDLITPFDFYSNGHANQLICYRPGTGTIWVMNNNAPTNGIYLPNFVPIPAVTTNSGIGAAPNNYNLADSRDRLVPYDMDGTGKLDHLICYRPGGGQFWIFNVVNGTWNNLVKSSIGVGTSTAHYDLSDSRDVVVPFDFYSTGKATQLLCYRPGTGLCWVMNNTALPGQPANFVPVYQTTGGIGYYPGIDQLYFNLADNRDQLLPYDLTGSGHADGLICYRPGTGVVYEMKHDAQNGFYTWFAQTAGIWNNGVPYNLKYDFSSSADRIIPYDYYSNGMTNNIVCYRPGGGACYMMVGFTTDGYGNILYHASNGIGSGSTFFDLSNGNDKVFAYDFSGTGKIDHLVCYRPGGKAIWIFGNALNKIY